MHTRAMTAALASDACESGIALSAERLLRRHASFVARFLVRLGLQPDEIEDAVQEVFLVAHRQGGYRPGPAQPRTWLAAIALRVSMKTKTRNHRSRRDRKILSELMTFVGPSANVFDEMEAREIVQRILDEMDPERRAVLILFELEGEACESIAAALGIEIGTVYSRLYRARQEFQRVCARLEARWKGRKIIRNGGAA